MGKDIPLRLYDTLSGEKKEIGKEFKGKNINLYTCGPTVYDEAHIGNLRSYIAADILRRVLKYNGYAVHWVMNITDVDDKTIKRTVDEFGSKATPADLRSYTDRYIAQFKKDLAAVNVPTDARTITFIRVSDTIDEIKTFIKKLVKLGYAYKTADGVYFNIQKYQEKFGDYGDLVGKDFLKGKKVGARVKVDDYSKDDLSDFALWKARDSSDGDIFWPASELGDGRPGWHIECSVVNQLAFGGSPTDIHTGGVDLIFPHHTNEIAQSEPLYRPFDATQDKPFVRHWFHSEHLLVDGRKMAKRENNFYTLESLGNLKTKVSNAGMAFRYLALQTNYRTQMNFVAASFYAADRQLKYLARKRGQSSWPHDENINILLRDFTDALNDDLNTAKALEALLEAIVYQEADQMLSTLGIDLDKFSGFARPLNSSKVPAKVSELLTKREIFRVNKQFEQSDALRKEIDALGYEIEDTPKGPFIWPK